MIGELTNHLWQSTLFAIVAGLLTVALRKNRAQVRYWLWFSASFKFLVPFSLLMSLGSHLEWAPAAKKIAAPVSLTMVQIAQPFPNTAPYVPSTPGTSDWKPAAMLAVWACGFAALALIRFRGWLRIRAAVRSSSPLDIPIPLDIRSSPGLLEPGVVGLFRPTLLLPAGIEQHLTAPQLGAVLAHEMCHVRRRDNLTSAIHMAVEAVFWFHPLVWWIGTRLVEERERACDEEVLRLGSEPHDYAEGIVNVCKLYVESPLVCVSGVTGSDIKKRIEAIMTNRSVLRLNFAKRVVLVAAGMAALMVPILVGMLNVAAIRAQSPAAATPKFEVASIRPSKAGDTGGAKSKDGGGGLRPGLEQRRFNFTDSLYGFILRAYGIKGCRPLGLGTCAQLSGGPDWLKKDRFDIQAKMPDDSPDYTLNQFLEGQVPQLQLMLQALLAERFNLKVHRERKQLPVYALTIGKKGPKLKKSGEVQMVQLKDGKLVPNRSLLFTPAVQPDGQRGIRMIVKNRSMQEVADTFSIFLGRPVLDRTGLKGEFDFTMEYAADPDASDLPGAELAGPALFTALQEQAGLKLESTKGTVQILVIDHAERPSEN